MYIPKERLTRNSTRGSVYYDVDVIAWCLIENVEYK
jgi:hypothetical protein